MDKLYLLQVEEKWSEEMLCDVARPAVMTFLQHPGLVTRLMKPLQRFPSN